MVAFQKELLTIVGSILFFWASLYTKSVMKTTPKFEEKSTTWYGNCNLPTKWDIQYKALAVRKDVRVSKPWCEDRLDQLPLLVDVNSQMKMVAKSEGHDGLVGMNFGLPPRAAYLTSKDIFMINPQVKKTSTKVKMCTFTTPKLDTN